MTRRRELAFWASIIGVLVGGILLANYAAFSILPSRGHHDEVRPAVLCISLVGLSVLSYVVWFSRWNVVAHTNLVFAIVAYVVPIAFAGDLAELPAAGLDLMYRVIPLGFSAALIGTLIGAAAASEPREHWRLRFDGIAADVVRRRVTAIAVGSIILILAGFAIMGFIPALAEDPLVAKFFRGPYANAYRPAAPLYRSGTTLIALLLPLITLFAWERKSPGKVMLLLASVGMLFLGLLREPAVSGVLLFIGVWCAWNRRHLPTYFMLLASAYFVGTALYALLAALGLGSFAASEVATGQTVLDRVVAGAPDLRDQATFLSAWSVSTEYTYGRTFVGGLIPGNFPWNPSVWSLHVVNPGMDIESIASGGLRLPVPIWGLVSFGWPGVVVVSLVHGFFTGLLARKFSRIIPQQPSLVGATCALVLYTALLEVVPVFFRLSYLSVIQLVTITWLLFMGHRKSAQASATVAR